MPNYAQNKKVRFDYEILETLEAGLVLSGQEVKSIRAKQIKLDGSYISLSHGEAFLKQAHISPYKFAGTLENYDPDQPRKLLLKKKELAYLAGKSEEKGLTIVPLSVYTKGSKIKIEIGIARGKKIHDKRRILKKRDQDREMRRAVKGDY